jgi:hypothetical protein
MRVFAIGIEDPLDVAVQRRHDADPGQHCRPAARGDEHQGFHRRLPLRRGVLGFRKFGNVVAGVLEGHELAPAWQRDWFFEATRPGHPARPFKSAEAPAAKSLQGR